MTEGKTLSTKGKTLVTEGKTLVAEGKEGAQPTGQPCLRLKLKEVWLGPNCCQQGLEKVAGNLFN